MFFLEKCVFTHMASIYANLLEQKKELRVQLPQDLFRTPIWPPWRYVMNGWRNLVFSHLTYIWMIPLLFNTVWVILKNFIHICFWSFNSVEQTKIKPFQRNSWPCLTDLLKENENWLKKTCILFSLCHYYSKWRRLEN